MPTIYAHALAETTPLLEQKGAQAKCFSHIKGASAMTRKLLKIGYMRESDPLPANMHSNGRHAKYSKTSLIWLSQDCKKRLN